MEIKPGTVGDFEDSMAQAMERALELEYLAIKGRNILGMGEQERRIILVAIAQGVTRHLLDNLDAFEITGSSETGGSVTAGISSVDIAGVVHR